MDREALVEAVLNDPEALWAVLRAARKPARALAGPWVPAESKAKRVMVGGDASWRMLPKGKGESVATVHKWWYACDGVREPKSFDYEDRYEDEDYVKDLAKWGEAVARRAGREWVYRVEGDRTEYAATKEEAMALADVALRGKGFRLVDTLPAKALASYSG